MHQRIDNRNDLRARQAFAKDYYWPPWKVTAARQRRMFDPGDHYTSRDVWQAAETVMPLGIVSGQVGFGLCRVCRLAVSVDMLNCGGCGSCQLSRSTALKLVHVRCETHGRSVCNVCVI